MRGRVCTTVPNIFRERNLTSFVCVWRSRALIKINLFDVYELVSCNVPMEEKLERRTSVKLISRIVYSARFS